MNSKSKHGKNSGKSFSASSKNKGSAPKDKKSLFNDDYEDDDDWGQDEEDEFDSDADLFNEAPKVKKQSGKRRNTGDDDFNFEDDLNGLGFLDDSYYDDEDDLY